MGPGREAEALRGGKNIVRMILRPCRGQSVFVIH